MDIIDTIKLCLIWYDVTPPVIKILELVKAIEVKIC